MANQSTALTDLTKEEKLKLLDLLDEKERRLKNRRARYTPNPGQMPVHTSSKAIRAVFSGNGAGKSCMGANEALWAAEGFNPIRKVVTPSPSRGVVVLDNPDKVDQQWLPELQKWSVIEERQLKKNGKPYYTQITFDNGSEILFMFHDQHPLRFESIEADWLIFDEPPPRKIYIALMRGLRKAHSQPWMLFLGTPITAAWMRKELWEPFVKGEAEHIECFRFKTDVNKVNLNWDFYEQVYFKNLSEKEKKIRREGQFFDLEGLALTHLFDRDVHLVSPFPWPNHYPVVVVIDPHPRKKHVACMVGADREGELFYIKEFSSASAPEQFSHELLEFYKGYRVYDIVCDNLGSTPMTGGDGNMSFIDKLNQVHRFVRPTTYHEKNDEAFINNIRQVLEIPIQADNLGRNLPKLRIFSDCLGIINDIENVEWEKWKNKNEDEIKPKLAIGNKDYLATLKYALATPISFAATRPRKIKSKPSPWGSKR